MLNFRAFDANDRTLVQSYTYKTPYRNCDLAFANMFVWRFLYDTQIAEDDGFLFVRYWFHSKPYYMLPLGNGDLGDAIRKIVAFAAENDQRFCMQGLTLQMKEAMEQCRPNLFSFTTNSEYSDYIYLRSDLAELTGKKYQPKRNHINQFKRLYPDYRFVPLTADLMPQCISLANHWKNINGDRKDRSYIALESESKAIQRAFDNYKELDLRGGALIVDNKVIAFTYGSPINDNVFDVAVEKADASYMGAYAMINNEFVKTIPEQYTLINREEDLGIEGLRKAKLSYHPHEILDKYTAKLL